MNEPQHIRSMLVRLDEVERREHASPIAARYTTAAGASISNNTVTIVNYSTSVFDAHSCVTTGVGWVFTAPIDGVYRVDGAAMFGTTTTWALTEIGELRLYKNGTHYSTLSYNDHMDSSGGGLYKWLQGSDSVSLLQNETINIRIIQTSGGSLSLRASALYNYVSVTKIN